MTEELADFVKLLQTHRLRPHTEYGRDSWAAGRPGEAFADTYADYLTHPERLPAKVLAFFETRHPRGEYRP